MKFLLIYSNRNSPSFIFYRQILNTFTKKFYNRGLKTLSYKKFNCKKDYDLVFFMSGCNIIYKKSKGAKFILIDPRANHFNNLELFDGFIFNGEEQKLFFNLGKPSIILPVYPEIKPVKKLENNNKIITFHGDISHIINFKDRFFEVEKMLSERHKIQFNLIYNLKNKDKIMKVFKKNKFNSKIKHINFSLNNLKKYVSQTDVGIVPQLHKWKKKEFKKNILQNFSKRGIFKKNFNYLLEFKETSNLGRHFVFCQCKVPVVSDITISSSNFIENEVNSFLAYNPKDWFLYIDKLITDDKFRIKIGNNFYKKWKKNYSFTVLFPKLKKFILNI